VEQEAAWCQQAMSSILDATPKEIRICARSKRWWNADIEQRRRTVGRERRRRRHLEDAAQAKADLQKLIRLFKRRIWADHLQNLSRAEEWRAARYVNPRVGTTVEALTDRDGKHANTSLVKKEMLRLESFPPNDGDQYHKLPPLGSALTRVTEQADE